MLATPPVTPKTQTFPFLKDEHGVMLNIGEVEKFIYYISVNLKCSMQSKNAL